MYLYVRRKFFGMSVGVSLTPIVCSLFFEENMEKSKKKLILPLIVMTTTCHRS